MGGLEWSFDVKLKFEVDGRFLRNRVCGWKGRNGGCLLLH